MTTQERTTTIRLLAELVGGVLLSLLALLAVGAGVVLLLR